MYDRRGRLLRSVTTSEPEWTEQDVAEIQALAMYRSWLCPKGCGHLLTETLTHPDHGPEFVARSAGTCRACAALLEAQRAAAPEGTKPNPDLPARIWRVLITEPRG